MDNIPQIHPKPKPRAFEEKQNEFRADLEDSNSFLCPQTDSWSSRWVESKHKPDYGRFVLTAGKFYGDADKDKGELGSHP